MSVSIFTENAHVLVNAVLPCFINTYFTGNHAWCDFLKVRREIERVQAVLVTQ